MMAYMWTWNLHLEEERDSQRSSRRLGRLVCRGVTWLTVAGRESLGCWREWIV